MLKIFNISTLLLFVCFLFAPTITFALKKDVKNYSLILNEEEETHSKGKSKCNNTVNEEEHKEIPYYSFANFRIYLHMKPGYVDGSNIVHRIKDDLVFKIPLPPPEQLL